ncbi:MAG TPA: 2-hydroxyacid dehydrogenase [Egibacteraceae bacterium]|nr:2-hydroxyacid dehydrogenase [Egibacteraceae bacterium]
MRVAVCSAKPYDKWSLEAANIEHGHDLVFLEPRLTPDTVSLVEGFPAVCAFVNDELSAEVLERLARAGTKLIALRSAGFNHVDVTAADQLGLTVARVPAYSPYAVAEHAVALLLTLNRKIHRAHARVREGNFALNGLLGFDVHGKTVGIVGTGAIGTVFAHIMAGFGCRLIAHDPSPNADCQRLGVTYADLGSLLSESDIVSLHCPLAPATRHLIDAAALSAMPRGAMLINTSRGGLVDTAAVISALKSGHLGSLGLDVYEEEEELFFQDLSDTVIADDAFARLQTFPNVVITGHQAFFTAEALAQIAETTLANVTAFERDGHPLHPVGAAR